MTRAHGLRLSGLFSPRGEDVKARLDGWPASPAEQRRDAPLRTPSGSSMRKVSGPRIMSPRDASGVEKDRLWSGRRTAGTGTMLAGIVTLAVVVVLFVGNPLMRYPALAPATPPPGPDIEELSGLPVAVFSELDPPDHPIVTALLPGGPGLVTAPPGEPRYNLTVCALATKESRWLPEWITFHRLLGVQKFYLYDSRNEAETADTLLPFIEDGTVVLHHMYWPPHMVKGAYFHHSMLDHCTATYSSNTEWLASWDVDEFILFQPPAHQHIVPYIDPANRTSNALAWSFPLHDFLTRDYISPARAVPLARDGEFMAMGVEELDEHELVTQSIFHRRPMRNQGSFGKILLRAAYQRRPLAKWQGAHECFSRQTPESDTLKGIVSHGARGQYRDVAGNQLKACQASKWIEPLRVAHYSLRSLNDCYRKADNMEPTYPNDRLLGGHRLCRQMYQSPRSQSTDPEWRDGHPDLAEMDVPLYHYLIEDYAVKHSWVGQQTAAIERAWVAHGGRNLSPARKASAVSSIVALDFGRLSFIDP